MYVCVYARAYVYVCVESRVASCWRENERESESENMSESASERERAHTERQRERQTERYTHTHTQKDTHTHRESESESERERERERERDAHTLPYAAHTRASRPWRQALASFKGPLSHELHQYHYSIIPNSLINTPTVMDTKCSNMNQGLA